MKRILCFFLLIGILFISFNKIGYSDPLSSEVESTEDVKNNLVNLSLEEKEILESLFTLAQEIMGMEYREKSIALQIDTLKDDISNIEAKIESETVKYDINLNIMGEVLKSYQKNGANSYLELILSSESLSILLKRLNVIREISRNTTNLLDSLEASKKNLIIEKQNITATLELIKIRQKELREAIEKKLVLKDELEGTLASLQNERSKYEDYLTELENSFKEIKPIFSDTINNFVKMVEGGNLPEEVIDITLSLPTIKGVINGDVLRNILLSQEFTTKLELLFSKDKMELNIPEINIQMTGNLEILNDQALIFKVMEGKYMGLPLEPSAMEELYKDGYLELNFKSLLGKNKIKSIKIMDDSLELYITPVLF